MSEHGKPGGPPGQAEGQQQEYVVQVEFTDDKGRTWSVGSIYDERDQKRLKDALDKGHVAPR
jgi:hypothetical protein